MSDPIEVRKLLNRARKYFNAFQIFCSDDTIDPEIGCYLAHQTIEKTLKSWLYLSKGEYPVTVSIHHLLLEIEDKECNVEKYWDLVEYSPFDPHFHKKHLDDPDSTYDWNIAERRIQSLIQMVESLCILASGVAKG